VSLPKKPVGRKNTGGLRTREPPEKVNDIPGKKYVLDLYIAGMTPRSMAAVHNLRDICEKNLADRCQLKIIDIYQDPSTAKEHQIVAVPTLIKRLPLPQRRFIGDMSKTDRILSQLG
jgi:circadian clock protein KaiB